MEKASLVVDPAFRIGEIDPRIRGSFVEHLGRCVYGGIYEPDHPSADDEGFRGDVLELTRDLGVTAVRYPGGNFVSGYRWEDGIGPKADRPRRLELAWKTLETNQVGVDEFASWCRKASTEPIMAVNLGTRGVAEAAELVEYCNHPSGTYWSDLRVRNGAKDPHGVRLWCLGNEMDGPWQIGHKTAREYGLLAAETAKAMRLVDPSLELVACGSSNRRMPTFASWEAEVLEHTYDEVDYVSLHSYYAPRDGDLASFLASGVDMDEMIEAVVASCDYVRAKLGRSKRIHLSYDEWNVWYSIMSWESGLEPWTEAPSLLEDEYSVMDAVVVGSLLNSLLRHADRVKLACFAQLVNVIAPMTTENGGPAWRQSTYHPMQLVFRHGVGTSLLVQPSSPVVETALYGAVPQLDASVTYDEASGAVAVFAVNRSLTSPLVLSADVRSLPSARVLEHVALFDSDRDAINTKDAPDRVVPRTQATPSLADGRLEAELPPLSWNLIRLTTASG